MLKTVKLRKEEFILILKTFSLFTKKVNDLNKYKKGYNSKNVIYYNEEALICSESHLKFLNLIEDDYYTDWKQVIVNCNNEETEYKKVQADITGTVAQAVILKGLKKYYKEDEIVSILETYNTEYNFNKKQLHLLPDSYQEVKCFKNCIGYDINGAHNDALVEMFPKAKNYFTKLFNERKVKPNNKKFINYFVGCLVYKYRGAYNWIVQRTTAKLLEGITTVDGTVEYANTDGFIVKNNKYTLNTSTKLGEFKIEMEGNLYTYIDDNYWCIQYIKDGKLVTKGSILNEVRSRINLPEGKVIHYKKVKNEFGIYTAKDVVEEIKGVKEC